MNHFHAPVILDVAGLALDADDRRRLAHPLTGGIVLFARNWRDRRQLTELIADGAFYGMQTFDQHLVQLVRDGVVAIDSVPSFSSVGPAACSARPVTPAGHHRGEPCS